MKTKVLIVILGTILFFTACGSSEEKETINDSNISINQDTYKAEEKLFADENINKTEMKLNEHIAIWTADLTEMRDSLPKLAIGFTRFLSLEEWENSIDTLIMDMNSSYMSDEEIVYRTKEIIAKVRNAHTWFVNNAYEYNMFYYPISFMKMADGDYYITGVPENYKEVFGAKIEAINGNSMDEVIDEYKRIYPCETEIAIEGSIGTDMMSYNDLSYLGLANEKKCQFSLILRNGERKDIMIEPLLEDEIKNCTAYTLKDHIDVLPLRLQQSEGTNDNYWYKIDEVNRVFYFKYNRGVDEEKYIDFSDKMVETMVANQDKYDKFVVDLRTNPGGNARFLMNFLFKYNNFLKVQDTRILVGNITFSGGIAAVDDFLYYVNKVTIYGSETGGIVGGFTDSGTLKLDKSGNAINYSTLLTGYSRLAERKKQTDIWRGIIPDVEVVPTIDEYLSGYDTVYEKAVE